MGTTAVGGTGAAARRERGRQEMRAAILRAARELLLQEGADALSMRAVARAIGYSPAALYEYFPAKEDVLIALYFEGTEGLSGRMLAALAALPPDAAAPEVFTALGHAYRAYAHAQPALYRLVFGRSYGPPPPAEEAGEEPPETGFALLVRVAARATERGEFAPLPPPAVAVAAWAAVHGFVALELSGHLTGGPGPGAPPDSEEAGRAARDALFAATLHMTLYGFVTRQ